MREYWDSLLEIQKFFYIIGIPSTIILVLQTFLMFLGMDSDTDFDFDVDGHVDLDIDSGFKLITFRGIIAFLTTFGWTGAVLSETSLSIIAIVLISLVSGFIAMFIIIWIFRMISRLQYSGNIQIKNAIGLTGKVYLTIPPKRGGNGKINVVIQERLTEYLAVTDEEEKIPTGTMIEITGYIDTQTVIVKRTN